MKEATDACRFASRDKDTILYKLGEFYLWRARFSEQDLSPPIQKSYLEKALLHLKECFNHPRSRLEIRVDSGQGIARILLEDDAREALEVLKKVVQLLPTFIPRNLKRSLQKLHLNRAQNTAQLVLTAALQAKHDYVEAIELFEKSRGMLSNLSIDKSTDVSILDPEIAETYYKAARRLEAQASRIGRCPPGLGAATSISVTYAYSQQFEKTKEDLMKIISSFHSDYEYRHFLKSPSRDEVLDLLGDDTVVIVNTNS